MLFSHAHAFLLYNWESMFVGHSFWPSYTFSRPFCFWNNRVVLFQPMAAIQFRHSHVKILTRFPGESWERCSAVIQWHQIQLMSPCSSEQCKVIQCNYCLMFLRQQWSSSWNSFWGVCASRLLKKLLVVGRFRDRGTFADVGARRSQMGLRT